MEAEASSGFLLFKELYYYDMLLAGPMIRVVLSISTGRLKRYEIFGSGVVA